VKITASLVKELRTATGAGMMDCKKALTATDGKMDEAVDWLREKGIAKAAKKAGRIAAEGLSKVVVEGNKACLVEINSETDFVAKNEQFLALLDTVANTLLNSGVTTVEEANEIIVDGEKLSAILINATATIGEKITLRRFIVIEKTDAQEFGVYMHNGGRISAVVVLDLCENTELAKQMAMQVASMRPSYVTRNDVPSEFIDHERMIIIKTMEADESLASKPEKVLKGIVEGRLSKSLQEMCLVDQVFFLDGKIKCSAVLKENKTNVSNMVRYEVGEGIEKKVDNFADEVASMTK
jgi:elongation factor Ts